MFQLLTAEDAETATVKESDRAKLVCIVGEVDEATQSHEGALER